MKKNTTHLSNTLPNSYIYARKVTYFHKQATFNTKYEIKLNFTNSPFGG